MALKYFCDMCNKEVESWVLIEYTACASEQWVDRKAVSSEVKSSKMLCKNCAYKLNKFIYNKGE